jgi:diguanylate cyclase (GGDEF)-like protein
MNWVETLAKQSKLRLTVIGFLMVALLGAMDYFTSPDIATFIFYLIPILFVTWFVGKWSGILISVVSIATWFVANMRFLSFDPNPVVPYWNAATRFISFLIMTLTLSAFKTASSRLEQEEITSRTDALTGLANRRSFFETAEREVLRLQRYAHPLTIVYVDLDDFKGVNDTLGHATGDMLLKRVAETMLQQIRTTDLIARLGGDEFVILLPETDQATARVVVERIHTRLQSVTQQNDWRVTFSIGVVTFLQSPATADEMVAIADACMYAAKRNGKNRISHQTVGESIAVGNIRPGGNI